MDDIEMKLEELNKKMDMIMKHLGCDSEKSYDNMSEDEKNKIDEKQVMGKKNKDE
jgi:3-keto-L-gulonate-6-phosphate decarboxylase